MRPHPGTRPTLRSRRFSRPRLSRTALGETSDRDSAGAQFYVALPLKDEDHTSGPPVETPVLLVTLPATVVNGAVRGGWLKLGAFGLGVLAVATALGLVISGSVTRTLRRIESAVTAIGGGSLDARAPTNSGPAELRRLASAINSTAARLIRVLEAQRTFVADASHQLRTPLTALRLRLENIRGADAPLDAHDLDAALTEVSRGFPALSKRCLLLPEARLNNRYSSASTLAAWWTNAWKPGSRSLTSSTSHWMPR